MNLAALLPSVVLAFVIGFAIQRGRVCCVAAAEQLVYHGRPERLKAYLLVTCWSAVVILPLAWLAPAVATLSADYPIGLQVMAGPVIYGIGARLNGACAFGTLAGLTRGDLAYLGTSAGIVTGALAIAAAGLGETISGRMVSSLAGKPGLAETCLWALALALVTHAVLRHFSVPCRRRALWRTLLKPARWRTATALAVLGVAGGLLYSTAGKCTYVSVLSDRTAGLVWMSEADPALAPLIVLLALLSGGFTAARLLSRFAWRAPSVRLLVTRFSGGALMFGGAAVLPGGNDTLILYGMPTGASYAFAGYAVMIASLCILVGAKRWLRITAWRSAFRRNQVPTDTTGSPASHRAQSDKRPDILAR